MINVQAEFCRHCDREVLGGRNVKVPPVFAHMLGLEMTPEATPFTCAHESSDVVVFVRPRNMRMRDFLRRLTDLWCWESIFTLNMPLKIRTAKTDRTRAGFCVIGVWEYTTMKEGWKFSYTEDSVE